MILTTAKALDLGALRDELAAAGVNVPALSGRQNDLKLFTALFTYDASGAEIDFTPAQQPTVQATVTAHDATATPAAVQATADDDAFTQFAANYQNMLTKLGAIQTDMDAITVRAQTLSGITISGTLAQTQAQLQNTLRQLGTDLGTLTGDFKAVSVGLQRELKALAALKRRTGA